MTEHMLFSWLPTSHDTLLAIALLAICAYQVRKTQTIISLTQLSSLSYRLLLSLLVYLIWPAFSPLPYTVIVLWTNLQLTSAIRPVRKSPLIFPAASSLNELAQVYFDLALCGFLCICTVIYEGGMQGGLWGAAAGLAAGEIAAELCNRVVVKVVRWTIANAYKDHSQQFFKSVALVTFCSFAAILSCFGPVSALIYLFCKEAFTIFFHFTVLLSAHSEALLPSGLSLANLMRPYYGKKQKECPSFLKLKAADAISLYSSLMPSFLHCLLCYIHTKIDMSRFSPSDLVRLYSNIQLYCLEIKDLSQLSRYSRDCLLQSLFRSPSPAFFLKLFKDGYLPITAKVGKIPFALRFRKFALLNESEEAKAISHFLSQYEAKIAVLWVKVTGLSSNLLVLISSFLYVLA